MTVFVVERYVEYEGTDLQGIFETKDKAMAFAKVKAEAYLGDYMNYLIKLEEFEDGYLARDFIFRVSEWEVK